MTLVTWLKRLSISDELFAKAVRFGMIGLASSAAFSVVTAGFVTLLGVEPKVASVAGYVASMPVNFIGNRRFSFRSEGTLVGDLARYIGLHSFNILLTSVLMGAVVDFLGLHYSVGVVAAVVLVPLINFFALNWWVFRGRRREEYSGPAL